MLGPSTSNKIERFWKDLHESLERRFKELLAGLLSSGMYDPHNAADRDILAAVFIPVVQKCLDTYAAEYNNHRIKAQKDLLLPTGIPEVMWTCPEEYGATECGVPLSEADFDFLRTESGMNNVSTELVLMEEVRRALSAFSNAPEPVCIF